MSTIKRKMWKALAVATLLAAAGPVWAGAPAERIAARAAAARRTQERLVSLQTRLDAVRPDNPKTEAFAHAARLQLELAQKSFERRNTHTAQLLTDVVERLTALAEGRELGQ